MCIVHLNSTYSTNIPGLIAEDKDQHRNVYTSIGDRLVWFGSHVEYIFMTFTKGFYESLIFIYR